MTKIALISDDHWGVRNDHKALQKNKETFYSNIFFPYVDKYDIKHVINLGDTVDRRKYINFNTSKSLTETLVKPLYERGIESHFILGNHDVMFKDTNEVNALQELYGNSIYLEKMKIYSMPETVNVAGVDILMMPWICTSNRDQSYKLLETTTASVLMGHLELTGFEMYRGTLADHGLDSKIFSNFDIVCSGHYHHKSTIGNINYLGSTGQYTWSDYGDARGFHLFDTTTKEIEFINNPYHMFNKFVYDDTAKTYDEMMKVDTSKYTGTYVKIIVKNKTNPYLLEKVIDKFEESDIINLQVIEDKISLQLENDEELIDEAEDTITILKKYITTMNYKDKNELEKFMNELYLEALSIT